MKRLIPVLGLLAIALIKSPMSHAQGCLASDSLELVKLRSKVYMLYEPPIWNLTKPVHDWDGVELTDDGCSVKKIVLTDMRLEGDIPNLNLPKLEVLNLRRNWLSGSIPNFYSLPNLRELVLYFNKFSRSIPNFDLPKLEVLDLRSNNLSGTIPNFDSLSNLRELKLSGNDLSGSIPNFDLPNLSGLSLSGNDLSGTIPNFDLPKLEKLGIGDSQLSGSIPNFDHLPNLRRLGLSSNKLNGSIPNFDLPKLERLYLPFNQLSGPIPNFDLPKLEQLDLSENQLSGLIPNFYYLPNLLYLYLDSNQFSGFIPNFYYVRNLEKLNLSDNQLSGPVPDFNHLKHIEFLGIGRNRLTFEGIAANLFVGKGNSIFSYGYQARIPIYKDEGERVLYVNAGGYVKNNTYYWYKNGKEYTTIIGNNTLFVYSPGTYHCRVTNKLVTKDYEGDIRLILESDTISVNPPIRYARRSLLAEGLEDKNKGGILLFPNPAQETVSISVQEAKGKPVSIQIFDQLGTLRLSRSIKRLTAPTVLLNVHSLFKGYYYVRIQVGGHPEIVKPLIIAY